MTIMLKCKMCGGDLSLKKDSSIGICQYCGTQQTVPSIDDDKKTRLYNRANQYRIDGEFDKAYSVFESIANDDPDEAEAYWGMLLSEYGVEYVDDPKTGKKIPTCHRTLVRSVTSNENYKLACKYADPESRIMYEDDAAVLDKLQKRVLNASTKEEPYDVFICYKETDENGNRTADSVLAQDIYDSLTTKGMRVFFSRISLEDKLGQDYEPCIFAALNSAKVMLMVTTDSDHCNAVWVKNEWKRYLDFMKMDPSKTLIPVYQGISPYALPDEFVRLQAQNMDKLGAIQDLVRGVEKLLGRQQKAVPSGMTQEEKTMVDAIKAGQKRTLAMILSAVFGAAFCGFGMSIFHRDDILFFNNSGYEYYWIGGTQAVLSLVAFAMHGIGFGITCCYGLRSKGAHRAYFALYAAVTLGICGIGFAGFFAGNILWASMLLNGVMSAFTALTAYSKHKKALLLHLFFIVALAAAAFASGAFGY